VAAAAVEAAAVEAAAVEAAAAAAALSYFPDAACAVVHANATSAAALNDSSRRQKN
jgi:hypothetical protein